MKVSVVIVTKDRPQDMVNCVQSIMQQSHDCHQVIIVDSSQTQDTHHIAQRYANQLPLVYTHSAPGITKQRNIARVLIADDTDIALYIDDDVMLPTNAISLVQEFFSSHPMAIGVTGRIIGEAPHSFFKRMLGRVALLYTAQPYGITAGMFNIINSPRQLQTARWLPGAFMAYRWDAVSEIEFDEWFTTYGLGEDLDFSLRARQCGGLYCEPKLEIEHRHSSEGRDWKRFGIMRIVNRDYLRKKHFPGAFYWFGFWWANAWLLAINVLRAPFSQRYRAECVGNLVGVIRLIFG